MITQPVVLPSEGVLQTSLLIPGGSSSSNREGTLPSLEEESKQSHDFEQLPEGEEVYSYESSSVDHTHLNEVSSRFEERRLTELQAINDKYAG